MGILIALLRGTPCGGNHVGFALLKKLIIAFGFIFAILKFAIVLPSCSLISIAVRCCAIGRTRTAPKTFNLTRLTSVQNQSMCQDCCRSVIFVTGLTLAVCVLILV
jgi:hypothetical protein